MKLFIATPLYQKAILLFILFFLILILFLFSEGSSPKNFRWTMVNVNTKLQGDAHLIEVNGKTILIDTGYKKEAKRNLLPFLKAENIDQLDMVFVSHAHRDHYEGIKPIIKAGITIKEIYFNLPDKKLCKREFPWGCIYKSVLAHRKFFKNKGIPLKKAEAGQQFDLGEGALLKILYAFDGINTPVGKTDINDMSLIMMLEYFGKRVLFTGDLNHPIGQYITEHADDIQADVLKVPHHGGEGMPPNRFFERVAPRFALVPAPKELWCSGRRGTRIKKWFQENNIPIYVNGLSGNIEVIIEDDEIRVTSEYGFKDCDSL